MYMNARKQSTDVDDAHRQTIYVDECSYTEYRCR